MSRSRKKNPVSTDGGVKSVRWWKRQANKAVRNYQKSVDNGKSYKRLFETYNIHDHKAYGLSRKDYEWWLKYEPEYKIWMK
jgi:DNA relaxase NicK